jgi:hypothetical protein
MKFPVEKLPKERTWNLSEDSRTENTNIKVDAEENQVETTFKERNKTINEDTMPEKTGGGGW